MKRIEPYLFGFCLYLAALRYGLATVWLAWRVSQRRTWIMGYLVPRTAWCVGVVPPAVPDSILWLTRI